MMSQNIRILLIEDNPGDARLLRELLKEIKSGQFELAHADHLAAGLELLAQESFDILLLDLGLPDSNGLDTLTQTQSQAPHVPVILLTGLDDEALALEAMRGGAQDYLLKGELDSRMLARTIRYAIERKRGQEELHRRNRELALLNQIIASSAAGLDSEALLEVACRELAKTFNLPKVAARLINQKKNESVVVAEYRAGHLPAMLNTTTSITQDALLQYLLKNKRPLAVDDTSPGLQLKPFKDLLRQRGIASLLILPLIISEQVIGCLALESIEARHFSTEEISLAWSVADQITGALARVRLNKERQLLSTAVEQIAESIVITDANGAIMYVNPAFERVTGYNKEEVIGQNPNILKSDQQDDEFYQKLWSTITAGQVWQGRFTNRKKDGSLYTEEATITPVRDENGTIVNYVGAKRDITRELKLEEQYHQSQKMEAIGQLTGGVAHDFNNLLTVINGFTELMRAQLSPHDPLVETIDKVLEAGERASDLVRQLLAFSRKQILEPKVLNLNDIVTNIDKMLQRVIGENIDLQMRLSPSLWSVKVDPTQMEQIIVNLAVNSRDAMPDGGQLTIETANVVLDEAYASEHMDVEPGNYVMLAVSDTGVGMSPGVKKRIFEPFFTTKEGGKGSGLGLATVFGIVQQHGGTVWCYSEPGAGATFKIYLPQADAPAQTYAPPPAAKGGAQLPTGHETILLVEDDDGVRELTRRILQRQGYTILEAHNGQEALMLSLRYSGPIHLLLTDVIMPGVSGKAVVEQISQQQPDIKTLYMSGYTDEAIAHHGVLEPGAAFLQKPFSPKTLVCKIREVLDGQNPC